jgi:gamma-glutamyltranspeptidase/glutathione hydrolase
MAIAGKLSELRSQPGFANAFLANNAVPASGSLMVQKTLAATLRRIARAGPDDFYRGDLARLIARDLETAGSALRLADLQQHHPRLRDPLMLAHSKGRIYNLPAPTQGLVALVILGILDQLKAHRLPMNSADYLHLAVEANKQAFALRDAHITDPAWMTTDARKFLRPQSLRELAARIDRHRASAWGATSVPADTVWMGVMDGEGRAVSCIQSVYHEFGSGLVLPHTGITWQNRVCSFSLNPSHINALAPGKQPFQTLCPSMAQFKDGRTAVYGAMGGDGQPQSQCALFTRMFDHGLSPQAAVSAPRWLLGRTWGQASDTLKLESRFPLSLAEKLGGMGHRIEILPAWDEAMGHAGAIVRNIEGVLEGGADPRSDGVVAGY